MEAKKPPENLADEIGDGKHIEMGTNIHFCGIFPTGKSNVALGRWEEQVNN